MILPDAGETNYDKMKESKAHQFVEKIISGTVEKVELEERGKLKRSTNKRKITQKTPVAITSSNVQRAELIGNFSLNLADKKQVSFQQDEEEEERMSSHQSYENDSQGKPDIEINEEEEVQAANNNNILEDDQKG